MLDRTVEVFPNKKELLARKEQTITRPELAILMAGSKMQLTQQIIDNANILQEDSCACYLDSYFPEQIVAKFQALLHDHPLAKEIKATVISNKIINQAGCSFLSLDAENSQIIQAAGCYLTFDQALDADCFRQSVYSLDNIIASNVQYQLLILLENCLSSFCNWALLHDHNIRPNKQTLTCYKQYLDEFQHNFSQLCRDQITSQKQAMFRQAGVPDEIITKILFISNLQDFPFMVAMSIESGEPFTVIMQMFNDSYEYLGLNRVKAQLAKLTVHNYWEEKVFHKMQDDLQKMCGKLIKAMLQQDAASCADYFNNPARKPYYDRYQRVFQEVNNAEPSGLMPYIALSRELENLLNK